MPAGRPLSPFDLKDGWHIQVLDLYEKGGSDEEVKVIIHKQRGSFSNDLWERWLVDEEKFSEIIKTGRQFSHAWWMAHGRKQLENKDFSPTLWYMNMKNRFGWKDKTETDLTSKGEKIDFADPKALLIAKEYEDKLLKNL